ncbi:hypothetical protein IAR55_002733 [Kwoniella newhampshirensis]|uniref:Cysteine-rich transmembrane CYSTM domain-containing protein n=1 Tax=Kwoniella newhampshirensis TaxID=1651941 RepID=A0AAW0YNT2_9TREE
MQPTQITNAQTGSVSQQPVAMKAMNSMKATTYPDEIEVSPNTNNAPQTSWSWNPLRLRGGEAGPCCACLAGICFCCALEDVLCCEGVSGLTIDQTLHSPPAMAVTLSHS